MNFFGHAAVSSWAGAARDGVLGSMVPDFESMTRVRVLDVHGDPIQRGIEFHHQTDDAFHRGPVFLSLCRRALNELGERGVRRGTARAVAHIGTEMFLDGFLADEASHREAYLDALAGHYPGGIDWEDGGAAFEELRGRLRRWGAPHDYRDPSFVLDRLRGALRDRPKLAVIDEQRSAVARFLPSLQEAVVAEAPELLNDLRDTLGLSG
ncbi:MAG: hypothetical protein AAGE52_30500 [Myxococcota bacterium]